MSEQHHDRFDLSQFVLGYLEQRHSIVTPPSFGVHEVLLPDELAAVFHIDPYQRLSFEAENEAADTLKLTVNHPLVETIAEDLMARPASARGYINQVRLGKRGLAELARKTFTFPNARLQETPNSREQRSRHHYLRFNFKITYDSDEKQEEMVSLVMNFQAGHVVRDAEVLERLESYENTSAFASLPIAEPRWHDAGDTFSTETLQALLAGAEAALREGIADKLDALVARLRHFTELDLARIQSYYDDMAGDMERRRDRLDEEDAQRRQTITDKLAALEAESAVKLEDVRARYQLGVELKLINILLLEQPKVFTPVTISNRTATITRFAVWDPLVHRLEPLVCDVCGRPGEGLFLCTGGHLAHSECLAPGCIDCKRVYCQICADQMLECAVCHQPVCRTSLIHCDTCDRGTCREHQGLCHAADGEPIDLAELTPVLAPEPEPAPPPAPKPPSKPPSKERQTPRGQSSSARRRKGSRSLSGPKPRVRGVRIHVEVFEQEPLIRAYVMRSTKRTLATRIFDLTPDGINITCECEKSHCTANDYIYRPADSRNIDKQIADKLKVLREEYMVPPKKVTYYYIAGSRIRESQKLILPAIWKMEDMLAQARAGFDRLTD
ncbi:MAG: hypothetical protein GXP37_15015 [Chloroflexi bacterium]|nr:hypothetical protein [Chloroflexota bacterium]